MEEESIEYCIEDLMDFVKRKTSDNQFEIEIMMQERNDKIMITSYYLNNIEK